MNNLIDQAASHARLLTTKTTADALGSKKSHVKAVRAALLPVESEAIAVCNEAILTLEGGIKEIEALTGIDGLKKLDPAPFTWRTKDGMPKLMPFDVNKQGVSDISGVEGFRLAFPSSVEPFYEDVRTKLRRISRVDLFPKVPFFGGVLGFAAGIGMAPFVVAGTENHPPLVAAMIMFAVFGTFIGFLLLSILNDVVLTRLFVRNACIQAKFQGTLPQNTRDRIKKALEKFDQVFILAEVPNLRVAFLPLPKPSLQGDPLVVGYLNQTNSFYLIDKFDTTKIEDYITGEFTT
ncbi:MAG TPA: hypothetical protein VFT82_02870 [Candidatus Paceibacterota bacterium]|nr:hypothetical protein [Candidatus Paceibacterota bacterium]